MHPPPTIIRSKKRKRSIALFVESDGSLRVLAPLRVSQKWIEAFVASRAKWIERRREAAKAKQAAQTRQLTDGAVVFFQGKETRLRVCIAGEPLTSPPDEASIALFLPAQPSPETLEAEIRTALILWCKQQARRLFKERVEEWAERLHLRPTRLIVTQTRRQWGSCNAKNEIRLCWRLVMAAPELLDYVVVHELCHIAHKHHGPRFWQAVAKALPDYKERQNSLRESANRHELTI